MSKKKDTPTFIMCVKPETTHVIRQCVRVRRIPPLYFNLLKIIQRQDDVRFHHLIQKLKIFVSMAIPESKNAPADPYVWCTKSSKQHTNVAMCATRLGATSTTSATRHPYDHFFLRLSPPE
jgi:hypothetical protein